jgi:class 3 adenylate cyclase/predicted ATPase
MPKEGASAERGGATQWLEGLGLGRYADVFARHQLDFDVFPDLTEANLAELGVPLGDRKRLLRAIASLGKTAPERAAVAAPTGSTDAIATAERRQLTVMFCDMVGSTALSQQYDPEDVRDIIATYRERCARVVERYGGYIARYVGDGILVYFGYPTAHEDDAERAVLTGLEIVQAQAEPSRPGLPAAPSVRIGIATGLVVVGDVVAEGTKERDSAVGETPNVAARLQQMAPANCLYIASSTHALVRAKFEYEDLGTHGLRGMSAPLQVWRVIRPLRAETRFAAALSSKLTKLVNREEEIALLLMRWQQTRQGDGQVVLLSGEPGIGKSRIVQELRERIVTEPHEELLFQCSPYYTSTPFYPIILQLKSIIGFHAESPADLLPRLEAALADTTGRVNEIAPLFADLLSIDTGSRYPPLERSAQRKKDDTVSALVDYFVGVSRKRPAVMILEDAHWIDPTSREVLDLLVDRMQDASLLIIITCRPEFQVSWNADAHITMLTLNRLGRQLRATLVERVAGSRALPEEISEEIIVKTDGVPLFIEELTKAVLESNLLREKDGRYVLSGPRQQLGIPATLSDSLMARLDRMGPHKEVAQIGATIGREFSYELLHAIAGSPATRINAALNHLEHAGLIIRRGHPPQASYVFKHALVQGAAHSSLLHSARKSLHARLAVTIGRIYPERAEQEPELLAYHFTEAGQCQSAVEFWLKAGRRATKARANLEAIAHLRRGLEVLGDNPGITDGDATELALRIALGIPLIAAKGYCVPDVEQNYIRALELGRQLENKQNIFEATRGLWVCYLMRADLEKAHSLGLQMLTLGERSKNGQTADQHQERKDYLIEAHRALGMTMFWGGQFATSHDHLTRGLALYDPTVHGPLRETHGIDPGIVCQTYLGYLLWFMGCADQARQLCDQALSDALRIRHPFTLAFCMAFRTYLCQHLKDVQGTRDHAEKTLVISSDHGFRFYKQQAAMLRGWALVELGNIDEGLNQIRSGLETYEAMDAGLASPWFRTLLANAYVKAGRPYAALRALDDALAVAERTGERAHLAEIYRLHGEITLAHLGPEAAGDAEAWYRRSLEVARQQEAQSWMLRTSVGLAHLLREGGKRQEAAELIAPICSKINEGFDTLDVKEAMQVMNELKV